MRAIIVYGTPNHNRPCKLMRFVEASLKVRDRALAFRPLNLALLGAWFAQSLSTNKDRKKNQQLRSGQESGDLYLLFPVGRHSDHA